MGFGIFQGWQGAALALWLGLLVATAAIFFALLRRRSPPAAAASVAAAHDGRVSQRMALIDLVRRAGQKGWDVSGRTIEIADFLHGLREAGLDARVRMWGRPHRPGPPGVMTELHRIIPVHHWKDFEIDVGTIAGRADNFDTRTCNLRQSDRHVGGFNDLYVDRQPAIDWLDADAERFRRHPRR